MNTPPSRFCFVVVGWLAIHFPGVLLASPPRSEITPGNLRTELEAIFDADQQGRVRIEALAKRRGYNSALVKAVWKRQADMDARNLERLTEMVQIYGWPGRSLVGGKASTAAFLVVQHAEYPIQKKFFPLLKAAADRGELDRRNFVLLEDRILVREGKKQRYGTQLFTNPQTGLLELNPLEDEARVDERRAAVGLEPLATYLRLFGITRGSSK